MIDLQTQMVFMEDTVDKLDNIVTEQSQLIADQQRQLQLLYQKIGNSNARLTNSAV
ncbi:MAG: SlyX family protein [Moraxella osloensis]